MQWVRRLAMGGGWLLMAVGVMGGCGGGSEDPAPLDAATEPEEGALWCASLQEFFRRGDIPVHPGSFAGRCRPSTYCKGPDRPGCNAVGSWSWACQCLSDGTTDCTPPPRCDAGPDHVPPDVSGEDVPQDGADGAPGGDDGAASDAFDDVGRDGGGDLGLMDAGAG